MEPVLNEEQTLLRETAVRVCKDFGGAKRARELRDGGVELDREAWTQVIQAGWLATAVAEEAGGLGMGMFELSLVMEEIGKQLLKVPLVETAAAVWAVARCGKARVRDAALGDALEGRQLVVPAMLHEGWGSSAPDPEARSEQGGIRLAGKIPFVPYAASAHAFLVSAADIKGEPLLCLVPKETRGLNIATSANVDGSTSSELSLDALALGSEQVLARGARAQELATAVRELLLLGVSAELVGVANTALDMSLEYLKIRHQFGRPLGSFQALQHRAASCFVDIELNRSLVYRVFAAWDAGQCHPAMVSAAKARTARSAMDTTRAALQMHGAIGYTDEHDIGLYYKRAIALAALYGNDINHTERFSRLTVSEA